MSDNCKHFGPRRRAQLKTLVQNWRNKAQRGSIRASYSVYTNIKGISEMSEEEKDKAIAAYFEAVIFRYTEEDQNPKVPKSVGEMDRLLSKYQDELDDEKMRGLEDAKEVPMMIGLTDYSRDFDFSDILNRKVDMSFKKRRNALADIVERYLKRSLKDAYDPEVHGKIVNALRGNTYSGPVGRLYMIALLAAKTREDGSPHLNPKLIQGAFEGNTADLEQINGIINRYGYNTGRKTGLERSLMNEIVGLYMAQNKELSSRLEDSKGREIKAARTATKEERLLTDALKSVRDSMDAEEINLGNPGGSVVPVLTKGKLNFFITRDMFDMAEQFLNNWASNQSKKTLKQFISFGGATGNAYEYDGNPFDGVADFLWERLGGEAVAYSPESFIVQMMGFMSGTMALRRDVNGNITEIVARDPQDMRKETQVNARTFAYRYDTWGYDSVFDAEQGRFKRDADGNLKDVWTSDEVTQLMTACYEKALSNANWSESVQQLYDTLVNTKSSELVYEPVSGATNTRLIREMLPILQDVRDKLLSDQAEEDDEREALTDEENDALLSQRQKETRRMTTTGCAVVYDSKKLRDRTEAIVYGMLAYVEGQRWPEAHRVDQQLREMQKELDEAKKEMEEAAAKSRNGKKHDLNDDFYTKEARYKELKEQCKKTERYLRDLHDDSLFLAAFLKNNMAATIEKGRGYVLGKESKGAGVEQEAKIAKSVIYELTVRALSVLEERTGLHIILNRKTMQYDIADDEVVREEEAADGALREEEDDGTVAMKDKDMDFRDDIDPFAHLSVNVRFALSRFVKKDFEGNEIKDDMGNKQYWNPKDIYIGLMELFGDRIVDPSDLYRLVEVDPNNKKKTCRSMLLTGAKVGREHGEESPLNRTEAEAYKKGKPVYDILQDNIGRYPWMQDLIDALQEDWMSWDQASSLGSSPRKPGMLTTNLFTQLGQVFMARAKFEDGKMKMTNTVSDEQNAKSLQRHNYYSRAILANTNGESLVMLWTDMENGTGFETATARFDEILNGSDTHPGVSFEGYKQGMQQGLTYTINKGTQFEEEVPRYKFDAERITNALRCMGLDVEYKIIENTLHHGSKSAISNLRALVVQCKYAANTCRVDFHNPNKEVSDIYENNMHNWKKIYEFAAPLIQKVAFITSTTENGKTRQNFVMHNAITTKFATVGYGAQELRKLGDEQNDDELFLEHSEVLKRRREKIDAEFRHIPGMFDEKTGKYNSHLLQQFYEGNYDVGQLIQADNMDKKDYRTLTATEQLIMQIAAFEHPKTEKVKQREYVQFASMADVPVAQFVSVDYGKGKWGAITAITGRVLREHDVIQRHKNNRRPYVLAWAASRGKIHEGAEKGEKEKRIVTYYDVLQKTWLPVDDSMREELEYLKLYRDLMKAEPSKRGSIQNKINAHKRKHPDVVQRTRINNLEDFNKWANWEPRGSYFKSELKYGEVPNLNSLTLDLSTIEREIATNYDRRIEAAKKAKKPTLVEELEREKNTVLLDFNDAVANVEKVRRQSGAGTYLISDIIDEFTTTSKSEQAQKDMATTRHEVAKVFVAKAMQDRFRRYIGKMRVSFNEYSEKANLNRIERFLRGEPDFDGEWWRVDRDEDSGKYYIQSLDNPHRRYELNEAESKYYQERVDGWYNERTGKKSITLKNFEKANPDPSEPMYDYLLEQARLKYFRGRKTGTINGSDGVVHKLETILDFIPPLKDQKDIEKAIQQARSTSHKTVKVEFKDVQESVERLFYHTYAANVEMLEMFGISQNMFKSPEELTKRIKALYSNGLRLDTNRNGQDVEHVMVASEYDTSISEDLPFELVNFRKELNDWIEKETERRGKSVTQKEIEKKIQEILTKLGAYMEVNATDGQGHLVLNSYAEKTEQAGSTYQSSRQTEAIEQLEDGTPEIEDFGDNQSSSLGTIKQIGAGMVEDVDPDGNVELIPMIIKNSEAVLLSDDVPNMPRSAQMIAIERYVSNTRFEDGTEEGAFIQSIQRPSSVKTAKKGIVNVHYIQKRVQALSRLATKTTLSKQDIEKFIEEWATEVDNRMTLTPELVRAWHMVLRSAARTQSLNPRFLTFEAIDKHVHDQIKSDMEKYLRSDESDSANRTMFINGIQNMQKLMTFMTPCKSTEQTINDLTEQIDSAVMKDDGSMNEEYVMTIRRKYQHMQIRPTNHTFDSKAHLGSQMSYIMLTAMDMKGEYEIEGAKDSNGNKIKMTGKEIYVKLNQILAQRLLFGVREAGKMFSNLEELRDYMIRIIQNNPKYGPEMVQAINIIDTAITGQAKRFSTPISSVAVIYKVSDILTSIIRGKTHRRQVNGGAAVIEADTTYDDNLHIRRDPNTGKFLGVECYLPVWAKPLLKHFLRTAKDEYGNEYQYLDQRGLEESGLADMLGYRIPTEDMHSIMPLIVKGFLPSHRGSSIIVAKEITTLTGGDNDIDKLFLMIKNIDEALYDETGKLAPVQYDLEAPIEKQDEKALENMMIDLVRTLLTDRKNETRYFSPQQPNSYDNIATEIAHASLPYHQRMRVDAYTGQLAYSPESEEWDGLRYDRVDVTQTPNAEGLQAMNEHLTALTDRSACDLGDMVYFREMHALAKLGVAIAADNTSTFSKVMSGAEAVGAHLRFKVEGWSGLPEGITIDGHPLTEYCPRTDINGNSTYENCSNFAATLVDSGNSPAVWRIGLNLQNASLAAFFLRCGLSPEMMAYMINILSNTPNFKKRYSSLYAKLTKDSEDGSEAGPLADRKNFGAFTTEDLRRAQDLAAHGRLLNEETLAKDTGLLSVLHVMNYLMAVNDNIQPWTKELKMNSVKHALSNEPASAVYSQLLVGEVERRVNKDDFMIEIPRSMCLHPGLKAKQIAEGKFINENGVEQESGVAMVQAYYTCGIESFSMVMDKQMFYAHPAFMEIVNIFKETILNLPKDDAVAFIKQLHDEWSTFYLSGTDFAKSLGKNGERDEDKFINTRNYYRYQFPLDMKHTLTDVKKKGSKYAILKVLEVKDGRLIINDELLNETSIVDVRDSLVKMAKSKVKKERDMAKDLFLNAFFTDGLRFGYGSISKVFTPSFLADQAFDEYNEEIQRMCDDRKVTGADIVNFARQFIRNNYNSKKFVFGKLIRAVSAAYKDGDKWASVKDAKDLKVEEDECTFQDVKDLELWLTNKENNGVLMLEQEGKGVPTRIISLVKSMELKQGEIFRLQTSFSVYEQNLYMVGKDENDALFIRKLNDMLSTKKYCRDMDYLELADLDCQVHKKLAGDVWESTPTGSVLKRRNDRRAFLKGKLSSFYENVNKGIEARLKKEENQSNGTVNAIPDSDYINIDEERAEAAEDNDYVRAEDAAEEGMNNHGLTDSEFSDDAQKKEQPKRARYKGGKMTEFNLEGEEIEQAAKFNMADVQDTDNIIDDFDDDDDNDNDDDYVVDDVDVEEQPEFSGRLGEFFDGLQIMADLDDLTDEEIEDMKAELMDEHGIAGVSFSTRSEAMDMAAQVNTSQDAFIAVVEKEGDYYNISLGLANDPDFQQQWSDQYAVHIITGQQGINPIVNKITDTTNSEFTAFDDTRDAESYRDEVRTLISLINAVQDNNPILPDMAEPVARDLLKKLRKLPKINGFFSNLKGMVEDALAGKEETIEALKEIFSPDIAAVEEVLRRMDGATDEVIEDQLLSMAVKILGNSTQIRGTLETHGINSQGMYLKGKIENQLLDGIREAVKATLTKEDARSLEQVLHNATVNVGNLSDEERRRNEEQHRRNTNSLNEADRMIDIMRDALQMEEQKRKMKIEEGHDVDDSNARIEVLTHIIGDEAHGPNPGGVINYLTQLLREYKFCANVFAGIPTRTKQENLDGLYRVKRILQSHEELLEALTLLMDNQEFQDKFNDLQTASGLDAATSVRDLIELLGQTHREMRDQYAEYASKEFVSFVRDFVGEDETVIMPDGTRMTWHQLFEQYDGDISFIDKWLRSMSDTDDPIGQLYNRVVQKQKDKARMMAMEDQQGDIISLNKFIQDHNLTDFEFIFEHDENGHKTGYYLTEVESGKFYTELEQEKKKRDAVLSDINATKVQKTAAKEAYDAWVRNNGAVDATGHITPDKSKYASAAYAKLKAENPAAAEFLDKFMDLKKKYDARLGAHTNNNRAIQRRMTSEQRFRANFTLNPKEFWENTKRKLANDYLVQEDDYMEAGEESALLNFDGTRRMLMPAPYVRMLKNPDELSTDPIGCLVAYSYATANFMAMREIANPMEVGFDAMLEGRVHYENNNGRRTRESFKISAKKRGIVKQSRFFEKLRSFLDSQLYMRYIEDGDDTFKIFGTEFRKSKVINAFLHMSAVAQLGFNWLVDLANLANGILQTNIEAAGRRFFRGATLRKADILYGKALQEFIPDLSNPIKQSKLALVGEKLNIMQNFDVKVYNNRRNSLIAKMFNTTVAFMGTSCGNHWLYNRVAIAMMLETEVTLADGTKTNLWDALETKDNGRGGKYVAWPEGAKVNGELITDEWLSDFGRRIAKVNQSLLGIYNRDDMVMAQKLSMTKLLIAFRKHIVTMMDKRYRKRHRVAEFAGTDQEWQEGYMRTLWRFLEGLHEAKYKLGAAWEAFDETEKKNIWMAVTDIVQWAALFMLMSLMNLGGDDDDDDEEGHLKKICKFLLTRESHEMGSMLPTLYMPKEAINMMNQPFMGTSQIEAVYNFCSTAMQPWTWDERVKAGPFQGQSQIEMRFRKLPIPILSYYRNIDKTFNGIDNSTWFYNRGYVGK